MFKPLRTRTLLAVCVGSVLLLALCLFSHRFLPHPAPQEKGRAPSATRPSPDAVDGAFTARYPPGSWSLAPGDLNNVVIRVAQFVVTHAKSRRQLSLLPRDKRWVSDDKTAERSRKRRKDAFTIASRVAELASVHLDQHVGFIPAEVFLVRPGMIPKTSSGKRMRSACRALLESGRLHERDEEA